MEKIKKFKNQNIDLNVDKVPLRLWSHIHSGPGRITLADGSYSDYKSDKTDRKFLFWKLDDIYYF